MDTTLVAVPVKRAMIACAEQTLVLADRAKFPGTGCCRCAGRKDVDSSSQRWRGPGHAAACAPPAPEIVLT